MKPIGRDPFWGAEDARAVFVEAARNFQAKGPEADRTLKSQNGAQGATAAGFHDKRGGGARISQARKRRDDSVKAYSLLAPSFFCGRAQDFCLPSWVE